jgi:hypothetical protein
MTSHDMTAEEFLDMADKTRAQLAEENAELRRELDDLRAGGTAATRPAPVLPSFGLSEGTRLDILEAQNRLTHDRKVTAMELVEPFTGRRIRVTADDYDVIEPADEPADEPAAPEQPADELHTF